MHSPKIKTFLASGEHLEDNFMKFLYQYHIYLKRKFVLYAVANVIVMHELFSRLN